MSARMNQSCSRPPCGGDPERLIGFAGLSHRDPRVNAPVEPAREGREEEAHHAAAPSEEGASSSQAFRISSAMNGASST